ncbi:hypothetical protein SK128_008094, partial [Halocaridina rubra]
MGITRLTLPPSLVRFKAIHYKGHFQQVMSYRAIFQEHVQLCLPGTAGSRRDLKRS